MKVYPYIKIVLYELCYHRISILREDDVVSVTRVSEFEDVMCVHFINPNWELEHSVDIPIEYYEKRLSFYREIMRDVKLKELGL